MSMYGDVFRSVFRHYFKELWVEASCDDPEISQRVDDAVDSLTKELSVSRQITYFMPAEGWRAYYHLEEDSELPLVRDMSHALLCAFEDGDLSIMECRGKDWVDVAGEEGFLGFVGPGGSDFEIQEEFSKRVKAMAGFNGLAEINLPGEGK